MNLDVVLLEVPGVVGQLKGREQHQALSQLAREAVRDSAQRQSLTIATFPKSEDGAPLPVNGVYWSLAHKREWVCGAAALFRFGVDLERLRPVQPKTFEKIAAADEWALFRERNPESFFWLWTAKEAVLKANGEGLVSAFECRLVSVNPEQGATLSFRDTLWTVQFAQQGEFLAALATQNPVKACWHWSRQK